MKKKTAAILTLTAIFSVFPILAILRKISTGSISLWYDPARDLLSGLDNLHKLTLIGPTSGIPGVFYGPYWIWLLSMGQLISPDPRIVTLVVMTLPYLIIFPFILSRFSKVLSASTLALLWLLFLLGFSNYLTDLWNPHPAPLLILFAIYLQYIRTNQKSMKNLLVTLSAGLSTGLVMNFQLSFGIGMLFGSLIYLLGESFTLLIPSPKVKGKAMKVILQKLTVISIFLLGCAISFLPFLVFEFRHQFQQTKTLINAFTHYGGVVALTGLSKDQITQQFFGKLGNLLHIPFIPTVIILTILVIFYLYAYRKKKEEKNTEELKLISILTAITFGVMYVYLTAKNPIWSYHFIGFESIFLLLLGILIDKSKVFKIVLGVWVIWLMLNFTLSLTGKIADNPKNIAGNLAAEEVAVNKVQAESNNQAYTVFAYSPSIYTYEYAYLFQLMFHKNVPYRPELNPKDSHLVFLIFPANMEKSKKDDFINFRTPASHYQTTGSWLQPDGTQILKRTLQ